MKTFLGTLVTRFETLEADLNQLDAATGDGDHGTTILKGLRAAAAVDQGYEKAFRRAAGGASGSLFCLVIGAVAKVIAGEDRLDTALARAADQIALMGQAKPGDKTMLDALIPAVKAGDDPAAAAAAAQAGFLATRDMTAKRGRAKYVEGAGVGHLDAGARSVAEILASFAALETTT